MNMPIIRFEIEGMRHALSVALSEHIARLDESMQLAVENFCRPENVGPLIEKIARDEMAAAVRASVESFFRHGPGREAVSAAVREALELEYPKHSGRGDE